MLSEGKTTGEAAKALEVSEQTLHRWRNQYGGMKAADAKRLKELEEENGQPVPEAQGGPHTAGPPRPLRAPGVPGQNRSTQRHPQVAPDDQALRMRACDSSPSTTPAGATAVPTATCSPKAGR